MTDDSPIRQHGGVVVPFWMFLAIYDSTLYQDLLARHRPGQDDFDTFAAMVAAAYLGVFERGGYLLASGSTREERLEFVREVLAPEEYATVEAVAVPQRYREIAAIDLEQMIRTGSADDRVWAATWLALVGWLESDQCSFGKTTDDRVDVIDSIIGEVLVPESEEHRRAARRWTTACWMYFLNGPPPLGIAKATLGGPRPGWVEMDRLIPARLLADGIGRGLLAT